MTAPHAPASAISLKALYPPWRRATKVDNLGDIWDPEWDMFFCLCGAITFLTLLRRIHDRQIAACGDLALSAAA